MSAAAEKFDVTVNVSLDIEELIAVARAAGEKILGIYESERFVHLMPCAQLTVFAGAPHACSQRTSFIGSAICTLTFSMATMRDDSVFRRETWEVEQKSDSSPLTRADREANALICGALDRPVPVGEFVCFLQSQGKKSGDSHLH